MLQDDSKMDAKIVYTLLLIIPIIFGLYLYTNYHHLDDPKYKAKYEVLYRKVSILRGDRYTVLYYSYYLLKRWLLFLTVFLIGEDSALQFVCLLHVNKFGIIIYGSLRAHDMKWRRQIEFLNEVAIMLISYSLLSMTAFN